MKSNQSTVQLRRRASYILTEPVDLLSLCRSKGEKLTRHWNNFPTGGLSNSKASVDSFWRPNWNSLFNWGQGLFACLMLKHTPGSTAVPYKSRCPQNIIRTGEVLSRQRPATHVSYNKSLKNLHWRGLVMEWNKETQQKHAALIFGLRGFKGLVSKPKKKIYIGD